MENAFIANLKYASRKCWKQIFSPDRFVKVVLTLCLPCFENEQIIEKLKLPHET